MAALSKKLQAALDKRKAHEAAHLAEVKRRAQIRGTSATLDANAAAVAKLPATGTSPPAPKGPAK